MLMLTIVIAIGCNNENKAVVESNSKKIAEYPEYIEFPSLDGLVISANVYEISKDSPVIVLCHQARFNKFEYAGIAEELNSLGFNCIAIDQRSGGPIGDQVNETTLRAIEKNLPIEYLDAEQDIIAAVNYASDRYGKQVILWGSSYSSTLALYIATENDDVMAVVSFSPGNYLMNYKGSLIDKLEGFDKPVFITSSRREATETKKLVEKMEPDDNQIVFVPDGTGHHGSRALWKTQSDGEEYWNAITAFLNKIRNQD